MNVSRPALNSPESLRAAYERVLATALLAVALIFYALPLTLPIPLLDPDEGLHASIAQEMVERGDWVTPRFLGEPFLDKPALFFWAQAASLRVLGMTTLAVRVPGLMFGLLGTLTTALLGWRLLSRRAGLLAGLFYTTLVVPLAVNQAAVHDVALVPWSNLALLFLWLAHRADRTSRMFIHGIGAGVFLGLACLTKGLSGVAVVGTAVGLTLLWQRALTLRILLVGALSLAVALLLAAPWYLAVERLHPGYLHYYFVERHVLGFATTTQLHGSRPWWYYLPILLAGGLPWVAYLPVAFAKWRSWWRSADARARAVGFLWTWLGGGTVFFSLARSKLLTYVLPVFPAIALLAADAWDRMLEDQAERRRSTASLGVWIHAWVGALLLPIAAGVSRWRFGLPVGWALWVAAAGLAVGSLAMVPAWRRQHPARVVSLGISTLVAFFVVIMVVAMPTAAPRFTAKPLADYLNARGEFPRQLWIVDERIGSLVFYLDATLRRDLGPDRLRRVGPTEVRGWIDRADAGVLVAVPEESLDKLAQALELGDAAHDRAGRYFVYRVETLQEQTRQTVGN